MIHLLQIFVFFLVFISHKHEVIAQFSPPYSSIIVPLNKHTDAAKPLYSVRIMTHDTNLQFIYSNFLIDIDAPFTWRGCRLNWDMHPGGCGNHLCTSPISCHGYQCKEVRNSYSSKSPYYCPPVEDWDEEGVCYCPINVVDPLDGKCGPTSYLNYDTFFVNASNGRNPLPNVYAAHTNVGCVDPDIAFQSYPKYVSGVIALSTSPYALPASLNQPHLKRIFSLCIPSASSAPGILFYGNGPYYLLPHSNVDLRSLVSYTPLLKHPDSFGYFIGIDSIVIKNRSVELPKNTTAKLSTIEPYTTLRTDLYNLIVRRISMVTKRIPKANPIAPFSLCYSTSTNGTQSGLKFPDVDFIIQGGKKWTISPANSIKQITEDVACLAFVDGSVASEHAIIIGTFQFEDNLLLFDLENSSFGFSSSLLRKQTSCANFNFTMVSG